MELCWRPSLQLIMIACIHFTLPLMTMESFGLLTQQILLKLGCKFSHSVNFILS